MNGDLVSVRYMVDDVGAALAFYTTNFGFRAGQNATPAFAAGGSQLVVEDRSGNPIQLFQPGRA